MNKAAGGCRRVHDGSPEAYFRLSEIGSLQHDLHDHLCGVSFSKPLPSGGVTRMKLRVQRTKCESIHLLWGSWRSLLDQENHGNIHSCGTYLADKKSEKAKSPYDSIWEAPEMNLYQSRGFHLQMNFSFVYKDEIVKCKMTSQNWGDFME